MAMAMSGPFRRHRRRAAGDGMAHHGRVARGHRLSSAVQEKHVKAPLIFVFHGARGQCVVRHRTVSFPEMVAGSRRCFSSRYSDARRRAIPRANAAAGSISRGEVGDRDLKLFDAMLRTLRSKFRVDDQRIYAAVFPMAASSTTSFGPSAGISSPLSPHARRRSGRHCTSRCPSRSSSWRENRISVCPLTSSGRPSPH